MFGLKTSHSHLALLVAVIASTAACGSSTTDSSRASVMDLSASQCQTAKAWAPDTAYKVGDVVSFQGVVYVVIQAHTSLSVWPPNIVPALFQPTNCSAPPSNPPPPQQPPPTPPSNPPPPPQQPPPTPPGGGGQTGNASGLVFSPYKDTSINMNWNTNIISTSVSGSATPLATDMSQSGGKTITLAFATGQCGSENWGGVPDASLAAANTKLLTDAGVKFILSTGGAAGVYRCSSDDGFETFISRWASPNLIGVDFDIEAGQTAQDLTDIMARIKSAHQRHPGLRFSLTLATLATSGGGSTAHSLGSGTPSSLNSLGDNTIAAVNSVLGFNGSASSWPSFLTVNLMTMDFGATSSNICVVNNGSCDMGQSAIQAAFNLHDHFGIPFSGIELTPMIGGNDNQAETFNLNDVDTIAHFATQAGLAGIHYWSYDRDTDCAPGFASPTCNSFGSAGSHGFLKRFLGNGLH